MKHFCIVTLPLFTTSTCLEWNPILKDSANKEVIIESLRFLTSLKRTLIYGFVLMDNHMHLLWQMLGAHKREDVQRDFLKYTSQKILQNLTATDRELMSALNVGTSDRNYQVWERNSLSTPLTREYFIRQKLNYIHRNPVRKGYCFRPEDYWYSSASFYCSGERRWDFLTHIDEWIRISV